MAVTGIDVRDWSGAVRWDKVAAEGGAFAFVRGAYGDKAVKRTEKNFFAARENGLLCGVYHFYRATRSAQRQVDTMCHVLSAIGFGAGALPPVLDVEDNPRFDGDWKKSKNADYVAGLQAWLQQVSNEFKCTPIMYTRASFWKQIGNLVGFTKYPLWVAQYSKGAEPRLPNVWSNYAFWQRSEAGKVDGVSGGCDVNRFNGTLASLKNWR